MITESALSVPSPWSSEVNPNVPSTTVSLLLFRFAFRAFRARYYLGMNRFGILRAENHRKRPLNGADRNRNYVNLRSPRVEYRTSVRDRRCYGRTIFQPDWTIVTFYLRQPWEFVDDCRSQRPFPARNGTSFTTSLIGKDHLPAILIKRGILDAWIDYASYVTSRYKASKSSGPR